MGTGTAGGATGGPFVLALDQGTTSSRAAVWDFALLPPRLRGMGRVELPQIYPRPGWVEHDPEAIWSSQHAAAVQALERAGLPAARLSAIGIANQRETAVLWDRGSGRPVGNAIVWQCRRTAPLCATLDREGWGTAVAARTGLRLDPYFSATKVAWMLEHHPGAAEAAAAGRLAFGTVDAWLLWNLTGGRVHATDATNASRTMLYDIHRRSWEPALAERLGIPAAILPEVRPTSGTFGLTDAAVLGAAVPVAAMAGDQQAALFSQGCWSPGACKNTYGTGCFLLLHTGDRPPAPSAAGLLGTVARGLDGAAEYALEGSVFTAGAAVQWLRDGLGLFAATSDVERLAAAVPDAGGVVFVPAFTGLGTPDWDPLARGAILGLTRGATAGHLCRAALEAIAFQTAEVYEALVREAGLAGSELRVDGGAAAADLLLQIQADLLGAAVVRAPTLESTALGAALLAALGAGLAASPAELAPAVAGGRRFLPRSEPAWRFAERARWRRGVERALGWAPPGA